MDSTTIWKIAAQGFILISIGIIVLIYTNKQPKSELFSIKFKGYCGGITAIIIGIIHMLNEFHVW